MTTKPTIIAGVPFLALSHPDGRFLRLPDLFAFALHPASFMPDAAPQG